MNKNNADFDIIDITPENIADYGVCGYKDVKKHLELRRKIDWYYVNYKNGLRIKALISKTGGYQGMIEYIPGKYAYRPVSADNYMFIHCLFVGFKKEFKGKGFATKLINQCINDAKLMNLGGVAVVTRKGSFMAKKDIFIKPGFTQVDKAKPDFELFALKFENSSQNPKFAIPEIDKDKYSKGLMIMRCAQCPYSVKNVEEIIKTAENKLKIPVQLIELKNCEDIKKVPNPFGTFCVIYNGEVISHHPISNTRFENIMKSKLKY